MIKLLLFGLLCSLGYGLMRALGRTGSGAPRSKPPTIDRSRVVEADFEEVEDRSPEGGPP